MQFQLTPEQIGAISLLAAVFAQVIKLVFAWIGKPIDRKWVTAVLLVVGLAMAYIWAKPALPQWPTLIGDPFVDLFAILGFVASLILAATAIVGAAQPIYNLLLQYVFEKIGLGGSKISELTQIADLHKAIPPDVG